MGLEGHAVRLAQRQGNAGLVDENVQARTGNAAGGERLCQIGLVDQTAARDIDQEAAWTERFEHRRIDDAFGLVRRRTQHQRIGVTRKLHQVRHEPVRDVVHGAQVGIADRAAEGRSPSRDSAAHPPHPDDANAHAAESAGERDGAGLRVKFPLPVTHEAIAGTQVAARSDQQADGQIGHVFGQCPQGCGDGQAAAAAVREIDCVGADAVDGHHLEAGQLLQHRPRNAGVPAGDHGIDGCAMFTQPGFLVGHLEELVDGVERRELVVDRRDQDRIELQDLGVHVDSSNAAVVRRQDVRMLDIH